MLGCETLVETSSLAQPPDVTSRIPCRLHRGRSECGSGGMTLGAVGNDGVARRRKNSTPLLCVMLNSIPLHCIALHCNSLQFIAWSCISFHFMAWRGVALQCNAFALHFVAIHCVALQFTSWRGVAMQCNVRQYSPCRLASLQRRCRRRGIKRGAVAKLGERLGGSEIELPRGTLRLNGDGDGDGDEHGCAFKEFSPRNGRTEKQTKKQTVEEEVPISTLFLACDAWRERLEMERRLDEALDAKACSELEWKEGWRRRRQERMSLPLGLEQVNDQRGRLRER